MLTCEASWEASSSSFGQGLSVASSTSEAASSWDQNVSGEVWTMHFDGARDKYGCRAGIVFSPRG
jgi:hypothetical protein